MKQTSCQVEERTGKKNLSNIFNMRFLQTCNLLPIPPIPEKYLNYQETHIQIIKQFIINSI